MDIYNRLEQDHDTQRELAEKLLETEGASRERRDLWRRFKAEAEAHANAEEQTFYAELIEHPEAQEQARHSIKEHAEAAELIEKLEEDTDMSSSGWLQRFKKLKEELEHHMDEEESDVFALARKQLDAKLARELVSRFEEHKAGELA